MTSRNPIQNQIIKVLTYFDYFKFPLEIEEIIKFIELPISEKKLEHELKCLVDSCQVFCYKSCYLLVAEPERVEKKISGRKKAEKRMKRANIIAPIIMSFPFIRMVSISGSLSKGYADKSTDIDFFIVTTENQLWTARTLLHILKKISFLFRLEHSFCMNYFLSEKHLLIEEQNYFTAVELATLIPKKGKSKYRDLMDANDWIYQYLPNFVTKTIQSKEAHPRFMKLLLEKLLGSIWLNNYLMKYTDQRWRNKWKSKGYDPKEYELAFKTQLTVSKNHPSNYQKKILDHVNNKPQS